MIKEHVLSEAPSRAIIFGGLLLAVLINFFPAPFVYSNQIFFGNAIAITLAILYGPRFALIASIAASTVTYFYWQHTLGFFPFALEVLAIVFALHIKRSILIVGLLFWLTLGPAVVYGSYHLFSDFSTTGIQTITLKYVLNGILNILLGYVVFHIIRVLKLEKSVRFQISTSELLLNSGFFIALSISTLIIYFWLLTVNKELYSQLETRAINFSNVIEQTTANHLEKHTLAISTLATTVTELGSTNKLAELLQHSGALHPAFITMLASDKSGELIATSPTDMLAIAETRGITNVSDRDYFIEAKASNALYLSNAFQGQGFGTDPIVAISAPYYINNSFAGVIEGSLNLAELHGFLLPGAQHAPAYMITDAAGAIVYASPELMMPALQQLPNTPEFNSMSISPQFIFHALSRNEYIAYRKVLSPSEWSAISFISVSEYEQKLSSYLFGSFILLLLLSLIFGVITFLVAKVLTNPITTLIHNITEAKRTGSIIPTAKSKMGYLEELNALTSGYHEFTVTLNKTMRSLQLSTLLNEDLNQRLQEVNENLEKRVQQRTEQLQLALASVKAANATKSSFMANMSHEIRTPLHGILGMTEVLLMQKHSSEVEKQLEVIQQSGQHLQAILNDILDFSKIEAGKLNIEKSPVPLKPFIEQLVASYQGVAARKGLLLSTEMARDLPNEVMLDAVRVRQILGNILSNALKFTDIGSVIVTVNYAQEQLLVAITDTGIGIAAHDLDRLFEPFQQLDSSGSRKYEGTGLGLAISMQLAALMKAKLECSSMVGKGTTFQLSITAKAL